MINTFIILKVSCMNEPLNRKNSRSELERGGFTERQLARLLDGTPQRRYNLVNRALHDGELLRLRRGRYLLASGLAQRKLHPFVLAQALRPGSCSAPKRFVGWVRP